MSIKISISKSAGKYLNNLPRNIRLTITKKIEILATNPDALKNNITKLQGMEELCRLRVGNYRVIYTQDLQVLCILEIGARGTIY